MMGLLMDDIARRSYDADRASFLFGQSRSVRSARCRSARSARCKEGEAATSTISRVAEAEVAARIARGREELVLRHGAYSFPDRRVPIHADDGPGDGAFELA